MLEAVESFKQPRLPDEIVMAGTIGAPEAADTAAIDAAWEALDPIEQESPVNYFVWKLMRDPAYRQLFSDTGSLRTVYDAGFYTDRLTSDKLDSLEVDQAALVTPYDKLLKNLEAAQESDRPPVVLLTTGGFSPIHYGHLSMMETAKQALEDAGRTVVGGYFSPSHDDYVGQKYGGEAKLSAQHRIRLAQEATEGSDWLMVDPWESAYVPTDINFTDVTRHLKAYLQEFVGQDFDVMYVSGADNADFIKVLQYMDGGVCVSRSSQFNEVPAAFLDPKIADNPDLLFVSSDDPKSEFSSSKVRQWKPLLMPRGPSETYFGWRMNTMNEDGDVRPPFRHYIVRDDAEWSLQQYYPEGLSESAQKALANFKTGIAAAITRAFEEVEVPDVPRDVGVHYFPLDEQRAFAQSLAASRPTLNLDACTNDGPNGINFSRLFQIADGQIKPTDLISRPGFPSVQEQIADIEPGEYLFLDDDIATGSTLNHLMGILPEEIRVTGIRTLFNESRRLHQEYNTHEVSDIVDLRDFILGAFISGLVVTSPNGKDIARAPYMLPFVSGYGRASIPLSSLKKFSKECWDLNHEFFASTGDDLKLQQSSPEFQNLMTQLGFAKSTRIAEIADYYSQLLSQ